VARDRFGQQLGNVAAHVGLDLGAAQALLRQWAAILEVHVRMVILVDHRFEWHLELARVIQRGLVVQRNAPRAVVDVLAGIKAALLRLATQLLQREALARRLAAPARVGPRLEHLDLVTQLAQFVGRRQTGQAGAQHDDGLALAAAGEHGRGRGPGRDPHAPGIH